MPQKRGRPLKNPKKLSKNVINLPKISAKATKLIEKYKEMAPAVEKLMNYLDIDLFKDTLIELIYDFHTYFVEGLKNDYKKNIISIKNLNISDTEKLRLLLKVNAAYGNKNRKEIIDDRTEISIELAESVSKILPKKLYNRYQLSIAPKEYWQYGTGNRT